MSTTPERRRLPREGIDPRVSLQHGLTSWRLVEAAWTARLEEAQTAHDDERIALAEAKLDECKREIARIEKLLKP